jgi:uncharacterized protein YjeT (DUF2065 family)
VLQGSNKLRLANGLFAGGIKKLIPNILNLGKILLRFLGLTNPIGLLVAGVTAFWFITKKVNEAKERERQETYGLAEAMKLCRSSKNSWRLFWSSSRKICI